MRVCLLTDKPDHPLLAAAASVLVEAGHSVTALDPDAGTRHPAGPVSGDGLADVYLLKAHTPGALALARRLEAQGARVVNSAAATQLCQDRSRIAEVAAEAGLPMPRTSTLDRLSGIRPDIGYPFMVKSRHNRRADLVARVDDPERLRELAAAWPDEPVVIQEFMANSGWDHKLWVIAGEVFTAVRPAPADIQPPGVQPPGTRSPGTRPAGIQPAGARVGGPAVPVVREPPQEWADLALRIGEVFGLQVYGVDVLDRRGAAVVVDINAFPGIRGPEGAPEALAALVSAARRTR